MSRSKSAQTRDRGQAGQGRDRQNPSFLRQERPTNEFETNVGPGHGPDYFAASGRAAAYTWAVVRRSLSPGIRAALDRFREDLVTRFGSRLRELVLYGSQARGDATDDSDADTLVVIDALDEDERREVFDLSWRAGNSGADYVVISPLPFSTTQAADLRARERRLMAEIARDGVPLLGRYC